MATLGKERLLLLINTLKVQSKSGDDERMKEYIRAEIADKGYDAREDDGNFYITKGEADLYPCFVAHTDTVHKVVDHFSVHKIGDALFAWDLATANMTGIGGDDKVGIWMALQLLRELPAAKAAFFRDEEIGCQGAKDADLTFFADCAFAIQADRRGYKDVVTKATGTELASDEFIKLLGPFMEKYDKEECKAGGLTDVAKLKDLGLDICALNLSCGYWRPHGNSEVVLIKDAMDTLKFTKEVTAAAALKRWEHTYVKPVYTPPVHKPWVNPANRPNENAVAIANQIGASLSGVAKLPGDKDGYGNDYNDDYGYSGSGHWEAKWDGERARYEGKIPYFSAFRDSQNVSQIGDHNLATLRRDMNNELDEVRKTHPNTLPPDIPPQLMKRVDHKVAVSPCPCCDEYDLTVNRDQVANEWLDAKFKKLFVYCWTCRCDWYTVEEVLNGKAYDQLPFIQEVS